MAALVWVLLLTAASMLVAFTLTWRPRWLRPLAACVGWIGEDAADAATSQR
jgi:hypothetical protein